MRQLWVVLAGFILTVPGAVIYANSTPSTAAVTGSSDTVFGSGFFDLSRTAIVECMEGLMPTDTWNYVFPPSEFTAEYFTDDGKLRHQNAIDLMCSVRSNYSQCVRDRLVPPGAESRDDDILLHFIDGNRVASALDMYCSNKDVLLENFDCAMKASTVPCGGGVVAFMHQLEHYIQTFYIGQTVGYSCSGLLPGMECHIGQQLAPCNYTFAIVTRDFMTLLLTAKCRRGEVFEIYENPYTDISTCLYPWFKESHDIIFRENATVSEIIVIELESLCRNSDQMINCMQEKYTNSRKIVDKLLGKMTSFPALRANIKYLCEQLPLYKQHSECAYSAMSSAFSSNDSCIVDITQSLTADVMAMLQSPVPNLDQIKDRLCRVIGDYGKCLQPSFSTCNSDLEDAFETFVSMVQTSCTGADPNGGSSLTGLIEMVVPLLIASLL